jgi:hypothetical protein
MLLNHPLKRAAPIGAGEAIKELTYLAHRCAWSAFFSATVTEKEVPGSELH